MEQKAVYQIAPLPPTINKICRYGDCTQESIRRCPECGWDFCEEHIQSAVTILQIHVYNSPVIVEQEIPLDEWLCWLCDFDEE